MSTREQAGREPRSVRLAIGAIAGTVAAVLVYACIRLLQAWLSDEPDPALVLYSAHAGYFWRAWTALYAGGMIAFAAYVASDRHARRVVTLVSRAVVVAIALAVVQALFVP